MAMSQGLTQQPQTWGASKPSKGRLRGPPCQAHRPYLNIVTFPREHRCLALCRAGFSFTGLPAGRRRPAAKPSSPRSAANSLCENLPGREPSGNSPAICTWRAGLHLSPFLQPFLRNLHGRFVRARKSFLNRGPTVYISSKLHIDKGCQVCAS